MLLTCKVILRLSVTPWSVARQAPPSMGFSRQDYWSGLTFPSPRDLAGPGVEPVSPAWAAGFFTTSASWKVLIWVDKHIDIDPFRKLSATRNLSFSHLSSSISRLGNSICYASGSFCFNTPITFLLHIYICFNFPSCFCYFRTPGIVRRVGVR